jgi:hypothetical protein
MLSEEERLITLDGLLQKKKDLENELFKMPISLRTMSMRNKKAEIENKLNDVEAAINQFSKKKVIIKVD